MTRCLSLALLGHMVLPALSQNVSETVIEVQPAALGNVSIPRPPDGQGTGRVTGTVYCADTHRPARGAIVVLESIPTEKGDGKFTASTSSTRVAGDGSYAFEHVTEGNYHISASLPGYFSPTDAPNLNARGGSVPKADAPSAESGKTTVSARSASRMDLSLIRGAALNGQVLYEDGSPASQVEIEVQNVNEKSSSSGALTGAQAEMGGLTRVLLAARRETTDDQGHFRVSGLPPGVYRVAALPPPPGEFGEVGLVFGAPTTALHVYSGDTLHKSSAKMYELGTGDEVAGVDITIPVDSLHRVRGALGTLDGRSISSANLALRDVADDSLTFHSELASDGSFLFPWVPSGTYSLSTNDASVLQPAGGTRSLGGERSKALPSLVGQTVIVVKDIDVENANLTLKDTPQ